MMVKSTSAPQKMLMPQFQELVVSMSPKYIWKTVYLGGIPVLHSDPFYSPLSLLELLPDICVARENKGYTRDVVQLSVTTGLFSMTAIPRNSLCPSRVAANRRSNAECCSCS